MSGQVLEPVFWYSKVLYFVGRQSPGDFSKVEALRHGLIQVKSGAEQILVGEDDRDERRGDPARRGHVEHAAASAVRGRARLADYGPEKREAKGLDSIQAEASGWRASTERRCRRGRDEWYQEDPTGWRTNNRRQA